jgi:hypothetical protein
MTVFPIRLSVQLDDVTYAELLARTEQMDRPVAYVQRLAMREYLKAKK